MNYWTINLGSISMLTYLGIALTATGCSNGLHYYSRKRNTVVAYEQVNDTALRISKVASDSLYGRIEQKPIMLGLVDIEIASGNVVKYFNSLTGPHGESIYFERVGACCPFKTKNFILKRSLLGTQQVFDGGSGLLEKYRVWYHSGSRKVSTILFLNIYDQATELVAPYGFLYKN